MGFRRKQKNKLNMTKNSREILNKIETLVDKDLLSNLKSDLQFIDSIHSTSLLTREFPKNSLSFDQLFGSSTIESKKNTKITNDFIVNRSLINNNSIHTNISTSTYLSRTFSHKNRKNEGSP